MPKTLATLLGVEHPIIQAPMAGSQGVALAAAVSSAGGLGSLPCAMLDAEAMARDVARLRAATPAPFNLNFFCHEAPGQDSERMARWRQRLAPYAEEFGVTLDSTSAVGARRPFDAKAAEVVQAFKPRVVSFHFGLPSPDLLARVRAAGAFVCGSATTVDEAIWLEAHGVDAVIAQGIEAGGHRGMFLSTDLGTQTGTLALVPAVVAAVRVPVIAAGGIGGAAGVRAVLGLGASAVQLGTSYLLCHEATTSAVHRAALQADRTGLTVVTNVFSGRPARGLLNRAVRELGPMSPDVPAFPLAAAVMAPIRAAAESRGRGDFTPLWAGENRQGCHPVEAREVTQGLVDGLRPPAAFA